MIAVSSKQPATFSRWSLAKYLEPVSLPRGYPETTLAGLASVYSYVSHNNVDLERLAAGGRKMKDASKNTASKKKPQETAHICFTGRRIKEASKNTASEKKPQEPCLDNRLNFGHQFGL